MARPTLFAAAIAAALIAPTHAGEIKFHEWPSTYVPQEVTTVPVVMDIGYYVRIENQDQLKIKLQQTSIKDYEGCTDFAIVANFNLTVSCQITSTGKVPGDYSCSVSPANVNTPGGTVTVCAKLTNANLGLVPGGAKDVQVATVTVKVAPRSFL